MIPAGVALGTGLGGSVAIGGGVSFVTPPTARHRLPGPATARRIRSPRRARRPTRRTGRSWWRRPRRTIRPIAPSAISRRPARAVTPERRPERGVPMPAGATTPVRLGRAVAHHRCRLPGFSGGRRDRASQGRPARAKVSLRAAETRRRMIQLPRSTANAAARTAAVEVPLTGSVEVLGRPFVVTVTASEPTASPPSWRRCARPDCSLWTNLGRRR